MEINNQEIDKISSEENEKVGGVQKEEVIERSIAP
jgi:hypothetical protein